MDTTRTSDAALPVVDEDPTGRNLVARALQREGFETASFANALSFLQAMETEPFDIVFLDLALPDMEGMEVLSTIKGMRRETQVIIITGYGSIDSAVEATKQGAFYYLTKPCRTHDLRIMARRAAETIGLRRENARCVLAAKTTA